MTQTVQLFVTCLIDTLEPQIGEAVVRVLERAGVNVEFPQDQTCCGQPAFNAGLRDDARKMAQHTIEAFEKTTGPIVIPSGSCAAMLRHGYPELFTDDPVWLPRAEALALRTFEFTEFLVDELGITNVGAHYPGEITYHPSCHLLRGLGVDHQPRALLDNIGGAQFNELPNAEDCCGFGGVFSVEHPEISAEMLKRKINNTADSGADTVVVCDTGCLLHINGGLHRQREKPNVKHIAEILDLGKR
ncbi:MAG: (Fe-S)-binding protein [Anaerolineales bacterium]|nr:(Fe-S)-binding protein [Chloroflexota bacterium]MBL6979811.1 (Fe-S)-binding protein [Anaerolineales bacterium]